MKEGLISARTLWEMLEEQEQRVRDETPYVEGFVTHRAQRILDEVRATLENAEWVEDKKRIEEDEMVARLCVARRSEVAVTGAPESIAHLPGLEPVPTGRLCGVYFLVKNGIVVYVGQSGNVRNRITDHATKDFDCAFVLPLEQPLLETVERVAINRLTPVLNSQRMPTIGKMYERIASDLFGRDGNR